MKVAKYVLAVITLILSVYAFIDKKNLVWHYIVSYWSINLASYL